MIKEIIRLTSNMFKYWVKSAGRNCSQLIDLQFFMLRAIVDAHWISQNWQCGTENHISRHCDTQSLLEQFWECEKHRNDMGNIASERLSPIPGKVILVFGVHRKKEPYEPRTFKWRVMPRIFHQSSARLTKMGGDDRTTGNNQA